MWNFFKCRASNLYAEPLVNLAPLKCGTIITWKVGGPAAAPNHPKLLGIRTLMTQGGARLQWVGFEKGGEPGRKKTFRGEA